MQRSLVRSSIILAAGLLAAAALGDEVEEKLQTLKVRHKTEHYVLAGTLTDGQLKDYGAALEAMYKEYERGFGEVLTDRAQADKDAKDAAAADGKKPARKPRESKSGSGQKLLDDRERARVVMFRTRDEYSAFGQIMRVQAESSVGMHVPRYRLLMVAADRPTEEVLSTLYHEASHQFMHQLIENPPTWLDEGLATYFGSARPAGKGVRFSAPHRDRWRLVREAISDKKTLSFSDVLSADRATFYAPVPIKLDEYERVTTSSLYYAQSYTLIHMMMNDRKGRKQLVDYVKALADEPNKPRLEITERFFTSDLLERLEPAWVKYVKSNPER